MGQTVYHLDGMEQIRHLDMILSVPGIRLIQWTPVAGQPPTTAFIDVLRRIQKAGKGLVLIPLAHEMPELLDALDPIGVHYTVWGQTSPQDAADILALTERVCRRKTLF